MMQNMTDLLLKLHHYKEALEWAFQMDEQYPKDNQEIFCRYLSGIPVTVLAEEYFK